MKIKLILTLLIIFQLGFSQQYDTVVVEEESIDENNEMKFIKPEMFLFMTTK
jgi:hypothetical protein